ncbi:MAG: hypothetical protein M1836_007971 [Candelina mexicana]|nr:MAG: hypothetical protein M1836_007971 [Candelina mexicana]
MAPAEQETNSPVGSALALELKSEINTEDHAATPKRKGGRKLMYITSEERKQRNRQAQAAFRGRRTEYIKELETAVEHLEDTLQSSDQSRRSTVDECLLLRYQNSLLERILVERGIDIQTELGADISNLQRMSKSDTPAAVDVSHLRNQLEGVNCHQQRRGSTNIFRSTLGPEDLKTPPPLETSFKAPEPDSASSTRLLSSLPSYSPSFQVHMDLLEQEYDAQGEEQESSDYSAGLELIHEQSTQQLLQGVTWSPCNSIEQLKVPQLSSGSGLVMIQLDNYYHGSNVVESDDDSFGL